PRAHQQAVPGVNGKVSAVEQGMHVRPEQQPVVEAVLATVSDRTNMRRLKHRWYVRSADRAAAVIGIEHHCPEGTLAEPVRRQARVAEHRPWPVPWLGEVEFHHSAQEQLQKHPEVRSSRLVGEVVALALDDVGPEPGRGLRGGVCWKEADVSHEQTTDDGVLAAADRGAPVPANTGPHLLHAASAVSLAEQLPRLRDPQACRVAEEPPTDHPVVRVVSLEEKRLTESKDAELAAAAGLPEVHLSHLWAGGKKAVPVIVGHAHVCAHDRYCAPAPFRLV